MHLEENLDLFAQFCHFIGEENAYVNSENIIYCNYLFEEQIVL